MREGFKGPYNHAVGPSYNRSPLLASVALGDPRGGRPGLRLEFEGTGKSDIIPDQLGMRSKQGLALFLIAPSVPTKRSMPTPRTQPRRSVGHRWPRQTIFASASHDCFKETPLPPGVLQLESVGYPLPYTVLPRPCKLPCHDVRHSR
jgi:hypothetical protein